MTTSIETVRDYWDTRPCNVRYSPLLIGTRAYFEEVRARKYFVESHIPEFAQFPRWTGRTVLELGCGIRTDTVSFALAGAHVTAVELSPRSLGLARAHARSFGVQDKVRFLEGNVESLSSFLEPQTFDLVYAFGVLHHTPNPVRVITEIQKFMSVDSTLKLMLYNRHSWKVLTSLVNWRPGLSFDQAIAKHSEAQPRCPIASTFTPKSVRELLCDFDPVLIRADFIFPYRVRDYIQYRYVKRWYWRVTPLRLFRYLERHIGWHLLIDARKS